MPIYMGMFTPNAWDAYPDLRHYMIEDMEKKIDILNLTPDEIIDILGTNEAEFYPPGNGERGAIVYRVTKIKRHSPYTNYFISISENGVVEKTYTHSGT